MTKQITELWENTICIYAATKEELESLITTYNCTYGKSKAIHFNGPCYVAVNNQHQIELFKTQPDNYGCVTYDYILAKLTPPSITI